MQVTTSQPQPPGSIQPNHDIAIRRGRLEAILRMRLTLNAIAGTEPRLDPEDREALDQARDALANLELRFAGTVTT